MSRSKWSTKTIQTRTAPVWDEKAELYKIWVITIDDNLWQSRDGLHWVPGPATNMRVMLAAYDLLYITLSLLLFTVPAVLLYVLLVVMGILYGIRITYLAVYLQEELGASTTLLCESEYTEWHTYYTVVYYAADIIDLQKTPTSLPFSNK